MKRQPEVHSRVKYFESLLGTKKEKDRSKTRKKKKVKKFERV